MDIFTTATRRAVSHNMSIFKGKKFSYYHGLILAKISKNNPKAPLQETPLLPKKMIC